MTTALHWILLVIGVSAMVAITAVTMTAAYKPDARRVLHALLAIMLVPTAVFALYLYLDIRNRRDFGVETWVALWWVAATAAYLFLVWVPVAAGYVRKRRVANGLPVRWYG